MRIQMLNIQMRIQIHLHLLTSLVVFGMRIVNDVRCAVECPGDNGLHSTNWVTFRAMTSTDHCRPLHLQLLNRSYSMLQFNKI